MSTIQIRLSGPGSCRVAHVPSSAEIPTESPPEYGGRGGSFSATDLVAAGLGACTATSVQGVLAREDDNGQACSMGNWYWSRGLYVLALAAHERSLAIKPELPTLFNKAVCLADLGRHDEAALALREFIDRCPREEADPVLEMMKEDGKAAVVEAALRLGDG